jgi:hypothetical protein
MDHQPDYLQDLNNSDDRTHDFEVPLLSKTLRWHMPIIGEVPMMYFIPECGEEYGKLKKLIE